MHSFVPNERRAWLCLPGTRFVHVEKFSFAFIQSGSDTGSKIQINPELLADEAYV